MTPLLLAPTLHTPPSCFTCNKRFEGRSDRLPLPNGSVDEIQEVWRRVGCVQVGSFTGVYHRPASNSNVGIKLPLFSKGNGVQETWNTRNAFQLVRGKTTYGGTNYEDQRTGDKEVFKQLCGMLWEPRHYLQKRPVSHTTFGLLAPPGRYHTSGSLYHVLPRNSVPHLQEGAGRGFYLSSNKLFWHQDSAGPTGTTKLNPKQLV